MTIVGGVVLKRCSLTVLVGKLFGFLVRDVSLRLQVAFVADEDDHLRAHAATW